MLAFSYTNKSPEEWNKTDEGERFSMSNSSTHSTEFPQFVVIILHQMLQKSLVENGLSQGADADRHVFQRAFEQPEQPDEQTLTQLLQP